MIRVGILGGGPGGLITAHLLDRKCGRGLDVTVFEAGDRVGGKIVTRRFESAPALYEAGVAELYDYSELGPDPLRQLVEHLGLPTLPMAGRTVVLDGHILRGGDDIRRCYGKKTLKAIKAFRKRGRALVSTADYYDAGWPQDNKHPWARRSFTSVLAEVPDRAARRFLRVAAHSDLASEPHLTTGLYGLENCLMDVPGYVRLYTIAGGLRRLPEALAATASARILLNRPVVRVEAAGRRAYRVSFRDGAAVGAEEFDALVVALPVYWLGAVEWRGRGLGRAVEAHRAYYDRPAHYLRVSALFREPFWRRHLDGSYFQLDAFGGCCVYDEGSRYGDAGGVLSWLLAGEDALVLSNLEDRKLVPKVLDSLPGPLAAGRALFVEGRVDRWVGSVNAQPGGVPLKGARRRHRPAPHEHPAFVVVGDYLFDSTINGVMDSAEIATDVLLRQLRKRRRSLPRPDPGPARVRPGPRRGTDGAGGLKRAFFDRYDGDRGYRESFDEYFDARWVVRLVREVWGLEPPYRLLDAGSASGLTLRALAKEGVDAWGVENCPYIHAQTPRRLREKNLLADVRSLPFADDSFDIVYDTALCHVTEADADRVLREYRRVARRGVFFSALVADFARRVKAKDLFYGVTTLRTLAEWGEAFLRNGFRLAATEPRVLRRVWKWEKKANNGDRWYPDAQSMRFCFYTKGEAPTMAGAAPGGRERGQAGGQL
jgi:monoamine oxidase/SAM-dependent methyltransferase